MTRAIALFITTITILASCQKQEVSHSTSQGTDSLALKVALLPIAECDSLRNKVQSGEADSMGLSVMIMEYNSMMDIDTAIIKNRAHIYLAGELL